MPHFRFVVNGPGRRPDATTFELPHLDAAKAEAVSFAGQMLRDIDGSFWQDSSWQLDITDEQGLILCTIIVQGVEAAAGRFSG